MKKIIVTLILVLSTISMGYAKEKTNVYMFTKDGCSACEAAFSFFKDIDSKHPNTFDLYVIEVYDKKWNITSEEKNKILLATYDYFKENSKYISTPFIVINDYYTIGLPKDETELYSAILDHSSDRINVVKELANENNIDLNNIVQKYKFKESNETIILIRLFLVFISIIFIYIIKKRH